ncbi:unnamed protein product [Prunus armeniaca]|uniref:BZIP domain-containing protein n=1 Tax=Prunus armeniaca TaxID=36596 RepID=A0A6J5TWG8_PRUAR|nr:unnamed protein product [Prunus armeniaca]
MFTSPNIRASHLRIVKGRLAYTKMLTMTVYGWLEMLTAEDRAGSELLSNEIVKAEHDAEITKLSPICTTSYPSFSCSKSRRNLTEEEKEERRIRRILANRESARQTIRRRQRAFIEGSLK